MITAISIQIAAAQKRVKRPTASPAAARDSVNTSSHANSIAIGMPCCAMFSA